MQMAVSKVATSGENSLATRRLKVSQLSERPSVATRLESRSRSFPYFSSCLICRCSNSMRKRILGNLLGWDVLEVDRKAGLLKSTNGGLLFVSRDPDERRRVRGWQISWANQSRSRFMIFPKK